MTSTSTTSRLLLLLSLLQSRRDWPGLLLADRLEISHRTVRRDVDRLREMGYSIQSTKGPDGGYRLDAGAELPPLLFDDEQVIALAVALQAATAVGAGVEEAAVRALATVRQVMPSRIRHRIDALQFSTLSDPARATAEPVTPQLLVALSTAVRAREVLRFDYAGAGGTPQTPPRRAEPHHLVTANGRWYLVAWDLDRDDWRIFRVDRITPRTATGPRFLPRELPVASVHEFVAATFAGRAVSADAGGGARGSDPWPCMGTVILNLPAADVAPFAAGGTVEPLGADRSELRSGSWSWVALAASLGRFDTAIEVVEPPELVDAFGEIARRYAQTAAARG